MSWCGFRRRPRADQQIAQQAVERFQVQLQLFAFAAGDGLGNRQPCAVWRRSGGTFASVSMEARRLS